MSFNLNSVRQTLQKAVSANIINEAQYNNLLDLFLYENDSNVQFKFTHLLYYFGGLLAISALTIFIGNAWDSLQGTPLLLISLFIMAGSLLVANLAYKKSLPIPAGIMATISLVCVPLAVYNLQRILNLLPDQLTHYEQYHYLVNFYWLPMEFATLGVGVLLYYFYRFGFILFPISITIWYMSMDIYQLLFHLHEFEFINRAWFSLIFGGVELIILIFIDYKVNQSSSQKLFWLFFFALITFWCGISFVNDSLNALGHAIYLSINVFLLFISVLLQRRVFAIFGGIGIFWYIADLSAKSIWFPLVLIVVGLLIMLVAFYWSKIENKVIQSCGRLLPQRFS